MAETAINTSLNARNSTNSTASTNSTSNSDSSSIDENQFLNLFVQSLQNQDPLEPMSNSEMMQQLTQLTQIQNTNNMKTILTDLAASIEGQNPIGNYLDLIGKTVKVQGDSGQDDGTVLSVGKDGQDVVFEMENGDTYNVSQIVGVSEA